MGNCTGYCTGCKEDGQRYDNNQVRGSIRDKEIICNEDFGSSRGNNAYYNNGEYRDHRAWIVSLASGSGLVKSGSLVRFFNQYFLQFMAPKNSWLTTVDGYSAADCDWVLEKA